MFQYCEPTTVQLTIWKGMFRHWNAAVAPPRRQTATVATGLPATADEAEKSARCRSASRAPFGWP